MQNYDLTGVGVCWLGNMRYSRPLSPTDEKKWRALAGLNVRMYVIGFASGALPRFFTQHARFYLLPELPFALLRYMEFFLAAPALALWIVLRHRVRVLVAASPYEAAAGALVKQAAALLGRPVSLVVESHGDFEVAVFQHRRMPLAGLYRLVMRAFARYGLRHADALRAVSGSTRQQLLAWTPGSLPMYQFMTWSDFSTFAHLRREIALADTQAVVYAGTLIPRKGVHILIAAFARAAEAFPDAALWLVGKAENQAYAAQLRQQVEQSGLAGRVIFAGAVSQSELAGYMGRARALVLASQSEGLPRVVIEAMMAGLVVIATRVSGIPEVIEDGVTGWLIPPEDVDALAAALLRTLADPNVEVMGARAQAFARRFFSEATYVAGYRQLLTACQSRRAR